MLAKNIIIRKTYGERVRLNVEIAKTSSDIQVGLMNRSHLAPDSGMMFMFGRETLDSFWMKNTYIPLSIAFFDRYGTIIDIKDMQPQSLTPVRPDRQYVGAIEANQGFFGKNGINVGDVVEYKQVVSAVSPHTDESHQERIDSWVDINGGEATKTKEDTFDPDSRGYIEQIDGQYICGKCGFSTDNTTDELGRHVCDYCLAAEEAKGLLEKYKKWWEVDRDRDGRPDRDRVDR